MNYVSDLLRSIQFKLIILKYFLKIKKINPKRSVRDSNPQSSP